MAEACEWRVDDGHTVVRLEHCEQRGTHLQIKQGYDQVDLMLDGASPASLVEALVEAITVLQPYNVFDMPNLEKVGYCKLLPLSE